MCPNCIDGICQNRCTKQITPDDKKSESKNITKTIRTTQ